MRILRSTGTLSILIAALALTACACDRAGSEESGPFYFTDHVEEVEKEFDEAQFVSFRKDGLFAGPITLSDETRLSLTPPLPSRLTFVVRVPAKGLLQFGMGVLGLNQPPLPAGVRFRIHVDAGSGPETVFKGSIPRHQPNRWVDKEVDLGRWENSTVRLTFETTALEPRSSRRVDPTDLQSIVPIWGNPVLASSHGIPERPSVFLISIDCLRSDHLGSYGYDRDTTPRIDRLAARGVVFENALSTAPETLPSHMSMFTGLYPAFHGASKWRRLSESTPYLPELLGGSGYEVNGVVTGLYLAQGFGFERGFRVYRFFDDPGAGTAIDAALELVRRARGRSQFLWVHLFDPHWPYAPPKDFLDRFGHRPPDISDLLQNVSQQDEPPADSEAVQHAIDLYDAEILYTDRELGRLLDELESTGLYDRSLILVVGDHGEAFHEHGLWQHT
ncbi:MAG: sulfatase, partial [Vicinamibacteria bacterium]